MIPDLFGLKGGVSRRRYLAAGLVLFAIKYALDFLLTAIVFHRQWRWFPYLDPLGELGGMRGIIRADQPYSLSMWALALPFIWVGVAMTSRRLPTTSFATFVRRWDCRPERCHVQRCC